MDYEAEARDFIANALATGCNTIAVGDGARDMRRWEFDLISDHARRILPGIVFVTVPVVRAQPCSA